MHDLNIDVHRAYLKEREQDAANERAIRSGRHMRQTALKNARTALGNSLISVGQRIIAEEKTR